MHFQDVLGRETVGRSEPFAQPPGANGIAHRPGARAEWNWVKAADGPVIGAKENAAFGIEDVRQQLRRNESLPVMRVAGTRHRFGAAQIGNGSRSNRNSAKNQVTDVAGRVTEDTVGAGKTPGAGGLDEVGGVAGSEHAERRFDRIVVSVAKRDTF